MKQQIVEILWTGGFDSTFRVTQLSRRELIIQPYYLSDNRLSESNELNAIDEITNLLKNHPSTKCVFRPLEYVNVNERTYNKDISDSFNRILSHDYLGSQYEWLACFAERHIGIEMSIHKDDKALGIINKYGKLKKESNDTEGEYFVVNKQLSSSDVIALWGNIHLPLVEFTKSQMKDWYIENGYKQIMKKTWFCFTPIHGKPCGTCNPCRYTIEEGMKERFSILSLFRYYVYFVGFPIKPINKILQKIIRIIDKNR